MRQQRSSHVSLPKYPKKKVQMLPRELPIVALSNAAIGSTPIFSTPANASSELNGITVAAKKALTLSNNNGVIFK